MEKEVAKFNLSVIRLNSQKIPVFTEVKGKDWIGYGKDNLYPDYLIGLFERSSTNNAIITGKVNYVLGEGWKAATKGLTHESKAKINAFIDTINPNESLDELSEKLDLDFEIFDGFALEVIQRKNKKDFDLYHIPFNKIRTNDKEDKFYYSRDWSTKNQSEEKTGFKEYPKFDPEKDQATAIFYFRILSPRKGSDANVYPLPNYIGGTQAIETEIECQNYNLSEIKTGFSGGTMISFNNGIPKPEEMEVLEDKIIEKYSGSDAAGRLILSFSDGKDRAPEVLQLSGNDLPERYLNLKRDSSKSIFTSHKVSSPELFGVQQDNVTFGGRAQIAEQDELFQNTYVSKRQRILEKVFNGFASLKAIPARLVIKPKAAINANIFSEDTIIKYMPDKAIQVLVAERMGIDLSDYEDKNISTQMASQLYEENLLAAFDTIGRSRDLFHIVKSKDMRFGTDAEIEEEEYQFLEEEGEDSNPIIPRPQAREKKVDPKAPKSGRIEVLYSYELRADAPKLVKGGTSRNFCKRLIAKDLLYTRSEINRISNEFDTDVWKYKGGWYTNPDTDVARPQCRHIWKQNVVKVK